MGIGSVDLEPFVRNVPLGGFLGSQTAINEVEDSALDYDSWISRKFEAWLFGNEGNGYVPV